jgi:hypothetical protein
LRPQAGFLFAFVRFLLVTLEALANHLHQADIQQRRQREVLIKRLCQRRVLAGTDSGPSSGKPSFSKGTRDRYSDCVPPLSFLRTRDPGNTARIFLDARLASPASTVRGPKITAPVGQTLVHPGFKPFSSRCAAQLALGHDAGCIPATESAARE